MGGRWKENMLSREVKRELYERVVMPTMLYGSETWSLGAQERIKLKVVEMMCLRNMWHKESGQSEKRNNKK